MADDAMAKIERRAADIGKWLADTAPYCTGDQKHLDEGTPERAYWHYGYRAALLDALKLLRLPQRS